MKQIPAFAPLLLLCSCLIGCGTYQTAMREQQQYNSAALGELQSLHGHTGLRDASTASLKAELNAKKTELSRVQAAIARNSSAASAPSSVHAPNAQQLRELERLKGEVSNLERALVGY